MLSCGVPKAIAAYFSWAGKAQREFVIPLGKRFTNDA